MGLPRRGRSGSRATRRATRANPQALRTACPGTPVATSETTTVPVKNNTTAKVTLPYINFWIIFYQT